MRHEVAKRITNNKNLCTYKKKKKKICVQEKRESINIGMESLEVSPQA